MFWQWQVWPMLSKLKKRLFSKSFRPTSWVALIPPWSSRTMLISRIPKALLKLSLCEVAHRSSKSALLGWTHLLHPCKMARYHLVAAASLLPVPWLQSTPFTLEVRTMVTFLTKMRTKSRQWKIQSGWACTQPCKLAWSYKARHLPWVQSQLDTTSSQLISAPSIWSATSSNGHLFARAPPCTQSLYTQRLLKNSKLSLKNSPKRAANDLRWIEIAILLEP